VPGVAVLRASRVAAPWLAVLLAAVSPARAHQPAPTATADLTCTAVPLDPGDPERQSVGRLTWRGGLEIASDHPGFGGLSGLLVSADGSRLVAVSDTGRWWTAGLSYDAAGRLVGLADARTAELRDTRGEAVAEKTWQDAEDLAELDDGSILVSFEREHRIWRYAADGGPLSAVPSAWPTPPSLRDAPKNSGLEALTALDGGAVLALTEDHENGAGKIGYLWRDGAWSSLAYQPAPGFKPTAASRLPGSGDVLVLERSLSLIGGFQARLTRVPAGDVRPGAALRGEELARLSAPLTVDNFEALAARRGPDGEVLIYLLSDDNFGLFQRTLLLMFALED
jgi:YD repeat-containing protein